MNGKVKELWGQKFRIVKSGLDEAEVFSFISSLIDRNNDLATRLEHLDSITKLAERTVIEADKQAESIKIEIEEQANAKAASIIAEAEEKARAEADRTIAEAEEKARAEADRTIAEAEERAKAETHRIIAEAERRAEESAQERVAVAEQQAQDILKTAEEKAEAIKAPAEEEATRITAGAKQKAEDLVKERTAAAEEVAQNILRGAMEKAEKEALIIKQEAEQLLIRSKKIAEDEIKEKFKRVYQGLLSNLEGTEEPTPISITEESIAPEPSELEAAVYRAIEMISEEPQEQPPIREEVAEKESLALYEGTVELAIPPPVGLDRMLQLHKHLRQTPQIEVLNLGVSADKGVSIRLLLQAPTPLVNILGDLPEVEKVVDELQEAGKIVPARQTGDKPPVRRLVVTTKK